MKKAVIILTFVLITIFSLSSFLIYTFYLSSYQNDFQSYIKDGNKNLLTSKILLNPSQLYTNSNAVIWEDDNKEIIVNGVLYDIISISSIKGKVEITVLSDEKEQEIKKEFAESYNIKSSTNTKTPLKLLKQILSLKFLNNTSTINSINTCATLEILFSNYNFHINSVTILPEILPPIAKV